MPAETVTETVTVDRERLGALFVEALAAVDVIEALIPGEFAAITRDLERSVNAIAETILGGEEHDELWRTGDVRSRRVLASLTEDIRVRLAAAPPAIQLLALGVAERELAGRRVAAELEEVGGDG